MATVAAMVARDRPCPFQIGSSSSPTDIPTIHLLKKQLEEGSTEQKIEALKKTILLMLSGEPASQLLMTIIRFVLPSKDKIIKKLMLLYWEVVDKKGPDGKLLTQLILVPYVYKKKMSFLNIEQISRINLSFIIFVEML